MEKGIREVNIQRGADGRYKHVRMVFGPHCYVEVQARSDGTVSFTLGATHHGFEVDGSEVNGQLETVIHEIRKRFPETVKD